MQLLLRAAVLGALALPAVSVVSVVSTGAAQAAPPPGPTAVAVAPNGITYAGYAAGGSLVRIDAAGALLSPLTLPRDGAVDGLATDESGNLWVSYGSGASKLNASGGEALYVDYDGVGACPASDADSPARYGDIAVSGGSIYVSQRCTPAVQRYSASTGALQASFTPPSRTRGIAVSHQSGFTDRVFVALPDAGTVVSLNAGFGNSASVLKTLDVFQADGWGDPTPTGLAIDAYGQLSVVDTANNAVTLYDVNSQSPSAYRAIGHPTDPSADRGSFDSPTAIDWYRQDRPLDTLDGRLYVADTGNARIQSMDTNGGTVWMATAEGGEPGGGGSAPINTELPTVQGNPNPGQMLTCEHGQFTGDPDTYSYGWNRNSSYLPSETALAYTVRSGDVGQRISCFVRATNASGTSDYATSAGVAVSSGPATPSAPANTVKPAISGVAELGGTLSCSSGTWNGSPAPAFTRVWKRNGTAIDGATASSYVVTGDDVGQPLTCTVTGTNTSGSASATSAAVTPTTSAPPSTCPGPAGVSIDSAATYTTSPDVTLRIRPPAGATQVLISNDGGFDTAEVRAVDASCRYAWTLRTVDGRATQSVYVRFAGGGVDELNQLSDDIVYDATAPAVSPSTLTRQSRSAYVVKVTASDKVSGLARVQHASTKGGHGSTVAYHRTYRTRKPGSFAWIRVYDRAGNASPWTRTKRR